MEENSPAGAHDAVITWRVLPAVCAGVCAVFLILALAARSAALLFGLIAVFFAVAAVANFRKRYALSHDRLVITRVFSTHTVILSELASVEAVPMKASGGRVFWHLILEDRQGTRVRLSFLHTAPATREQFLTALRPFAAAPNVRLGGPVDRGLAGTLW